MVTKVEPVHEFESFPTPMSYETRGHVCASSFITALERDCGMTCESNRVKHRWARNVPVGRDRPCEQFKMYVDKPGRGAFAVTVVEHYDAREINDGD